MSAEKTFVDWKELIEIARTNPRGKVVASNATGKDVDNVGNWKGTDAYWDAKEDILQAADRLNNMPELVLMSPKTYIDFIHAIGADKDFSKFFQIGAFFGRPPYDTAWLSVSDEYEDYIVLIKAKAHPDEPRNASGVAMIDTR